MKKWSLLIILLLCFALPLFYTGASGAPRRSALEVNDVLEPYSVGDDEWIVYSDEEPIDDQKVDNAPECDIYGVIAYYDDDYLRVDILLNEEVSFDLDTFFSVKFEYENANEYYTYYAYSDELVYTEEANGKITQRKTLTKKNSKDIAGVTDSNDLDNADVYFIIDKNPFVGTKGNSYFLTSTFFSGFINENGKLMIADDTITVDLVFEK